MFSPTPVLAGLNPMDEVYDIAWASAKGLEGSFTTQSAIRRRSNVCDA